MCDPTQWRGMILAAQLSRPGPLRLVTPLRRVHGTTAAVIADCDDGFPYVVKGSQVQRSLIADHVVALMGLSVGAPVPLVQLVDVSDELILPGTLLAGFNAGVGHGSRYVPDCVDAFEVRHPNESVNRARYAALSVLFGWADCGDRQYLVRNSPPHEVWGIDFGHFFCGGDEWTLETLANAPDADIDHLVASHAFIHRSELRDAAAALTNVSDNNVAGMVAAPPETWGISLDDRVGLAQYIARRRDHLLAGLKLI